MVVRSLVSLISFSWAMFCLAGVMSVPSWLPEDQRFEVEGTSNEIAQVDQTLAQMRDALHPKLRAMMKEGDLGPTLQWIVHVSLPGVATNEMAYFESYKNPIPASAFDRKLLTYRASRLSGVPTRANLQLNVAVRPEPGIDYPGVSREDEGSTPSCIRLALRAPKYFRRIPILVGVSPDKNTGYEVKCFLHKGRAGVLPEECAVKPGSTGTFRVDIAQKIAKNNGETVVAVFVRNAGGLWGPPSYVRIFGDELCEHYYAGGAIEHIDYGDYCDWYKLGENNRILGFSRIPAGETRGEDYSNLGEKILEMYPGDIPKTTRKLTYYVEEGKLRFTVLENDVQHANGKVQFRSSDW